MLDSLAYAVQSTAHRQAPTGMVSAMLDLFDGHSVPALHYIEGRRPGFYKADRITKPLAFEAHALGSLIAGAYPFRGVTPWCACAKRAHTCDGDGARYFLLDLDAHGGEEDTFERVSAVLGIAWRIGLTPLVFASRGGRGAHIFIFLDAPVTTRVANAAGKNLAQLAGIHSRCDIIPSAEHQAGFGTLHALPLSPLSEHKGGGVMFDSNMRPLPLVRAISLMEWGHKHRSPAGIAVNLAEARVGELSLAGETPIRLRKLTVPTPIKRTKPVLSKADEETLAEMYLRHPQFRKVLSMSSDDWKGKRSSRDAYLVGYLRRQGLKPAAVVAAMMSIPGTKVATRGDDYVWRLIENQLSTSVEFTVKLAGEPLKTMQAKRQRQTCPWAPWDARVAPPKSYGGVTSSWWSTDTQRALKASGSRSDALVSAYLIDRYYRGPISRRMYFASCAQVGKTLKLSARTVGSSVQRLRARIPAALRVVPGVAHAHLRLANGFYVPERAHRDQCNWHIGAGRDG